MAAIVGIKDPLLRLDFVEISALQDAVYLMKEDSEMKRERWTQMIERSVTENVPPDRLKIWQGFLDDANRKLAQADKLYFALTVLYDRRLKRVK